MNTAQMTLNVPSTKVDFWELALGNVRRLGMSDAEYQACALGHHAAESFQDELGRGTGRQTVPETIPIRGHI